MFEEKIEENKKMAEDRKRPRYLEPTVASKLKARKPRPSHQKSLPIQVPNRPVRIMHLPKLLVAERVPETRVSGTRLPLFFKQKTLLLSVNHH